MLRRLYDEPDAMSDEQRNHYNGCSRCRERFSGIAEDAQAAMALMAVPSVTVDPAAALRRVRAEVASAPARGWMPRWPSLPRIGFQRRWLAVTAAVMAVLVTSLALAGFGYADTVLKLFEPKSTATITVHTGDVNSALLPDLSTYGDVKVTQNPELAQADSVAAAAKATGLPGITVGKLPSGVPSDVTYATVTQGGASFTFSKSKAQAAAAAKGKTIPPMPQNIDGSTLSVKAGPAYGIIYGYSQLASQLATAHNRAARPTETSPPADGAKPVESGRPAGTAPANIPPVLGVAAARAPVVTTTNGVTARQLQDYLLAQPGISPQLANQIRGIGDPTTTLPIVIPEGATSKQVTVQGVSGTLIGDNTGLGAGVIWIKNGVVYAVVGTFNQQQVLDLANGLKIS
jgi:hypothetical protein